jgi:hypothetical protein
MKSRWIPLLLLVSFSAFGEVSFEEKQNRIEYLESLQEQAPSMDIEAYKRELQYEKLGLSIDERAKAEASRLAEQIKTQIARAYEASLGSKSPEDAASEVRDAIIKDSELVNVEMREEIKELSLRSLEDIQQGRVSSDENLESVEKSLLKGIQERYDFLNEEAEPMPMSAMTIDPTLPKANKNKDAERREYAKRADLVASLASDKENANWISTGGVTLKSKQLSKREANISMQVKAEFLGVSLSAGPSFAFTREFSTDVQVMAEGMNPVLLPDGNFDFYKRDRNGKVIVKGGKQEKRFINFYCDAELEFGTEAKAGGGFSIAGVGGGVSVESTFSNAVNMTSRRVLVPEYIDGKSVTFSMLAQICMNDFLRARITNNMTVGQSLNIMMRNVVASLRFSHPKTKCVRDSHCFNWYNKEIIGLARIGNYPRCVEETREKFYQCQLRGLKGQNCAVFDAKGKRVSDGMFEFQCDVGLRCVKTQTEGWFTNWELYQYAKGKCMPINAKTYRAP